MRVPNRSARRAGFTLIELMLAVTISMIILYTALFSASEAVAVVSEGDAQVQTHVQARRALDRLLRDVRYATEVEVGGSSETGWSLDVLTTGTLSPGWVSYVWNADAGTLTIDAGAGAEWALVGLRDFGLDLVTESIGGAEVVTAVTIEWTVAEDAGAFAGGPGMDGERETRLSGSARLRIHD